MKKNVIEADKQALENESKSYVSEQMRKVNRSIEVIKTTSIALTDAKINAINEDKSLDDKQRGTAKNLVTANAIIADANKEIEIYKTVETRTTDAIAANIDASGKVISAKNAEKYRLIQVSLIEGRHAAEKELANGEELLTKPEMLKKTDDQKGPFRTPIELYINQTTVSIEKLKETEKRLKEGLKAIGTNEAEFLAKVQTKAFDYQVKDVTHTPSPVQLAKGLSLARSEDDEIEEKQRIKDNIEFISRSAGTAGEAFTSLSSAWTDGNAKYQAALNNYNSNTKTDSAADEKMVASFEIQREAIVRYHNDAGASAENAVSALKIFDDYVSETMSNNRGAKTLDLAKAWSNQAEKINTSLIENATERATKESEIALRGLREQYEARLLIETIGSDASIKLHESYEKAKLAMQIEYAQKAETPMQKLARSWQDVTTQMQSASAKWANSTIDKFMELATTGKTSFTGLVNSILTDILRIAMQKQMSKALDSVFGGIEKAVGGMIGGGGAKVDETVAQTTVAQGAATTAIKAMTKSTQEAADKAVELSGSLGDTAIEGVMQAGKSATASSALGFVATAATNAANALNQLSSQSGGASGGGGGFLGGLVDTVSGWFGGGDNGGTGEGSLNWGTGNAWDLSGTLPAFANGGIMTNSGPVELRKYANGGIANRPQMALFGEGKMNEAYVPLPDGKTIPVTMSGSNGGGVVVNVINNASGTQAREERTQNPDGSTSIDVIIEQVEGKISQNLAKGKGSLSNVMEKTYGLNRATGSYR